MSSPRSGSPYSDANITEVIVNAEDGLNSELRLLLDMQESERRRHSDMARNSHEGVPGPETLPVPRVVLRPSLGARRRIGP